MRSKLRIFQISLFIAMTGCNNPEPIPEIILEEVDISGPQYRKDTLIKTLANTIQLSRDGPVGTSLTKYDASGLPLWNTNYRPSTQTPTNNSIPIMYTWIRLTNSDIQGNFYGFGQISGLLSSFPSNGSGELSDWLLVKFDSSGNSIWEVFSGETTFDLTASIYTAQVDPLGNAIVVGYIDNREMGRKVNTIAKFSPNGAMVWRKNIEFLSIGEKHWDFYEVKLLIDNQGKIIIATPKYVLAYASDGTLAWKHAGDFKQPIKLSFNRNGNIALREERGFSIFTPEGILLGSGDAGIKKIIFFIDDGLDGYIIFTKESYSPEDLDVYYWEHYNEVGTLMSATPIALSIRSGVTRSPYSGRFYAVIGTGELATFSADGEISHRKHFMKFHFAHEVFSSSPDIDDAGNIFAAITEMHISGVFVTTQEFVRSHLYYFTESNPTTPTIEFIGRSKYYDPNENSDGWFNNAGIYYALQYGGKYILP